MPKIQIFMSQKHRHCDEIIAEAENLISSKNWAEGTVKFQLFCNELNSHLAMEEEVLFPAVDDKMGGSCGPTQVMMGEHEEMRGLLQLLQEAIDAHDADAFLGNSETLLMLIQQHNMKEEHMLYPMADNLLGTEADEIVNQMTAMDAQN